MYKEEIDKVSETAFKKVDLLNNNFIGYFISAILAGVYLALGVTFAFTVGGMMYLLNLFRIYYI